MEKINWRELLKIGGAIGFAIGTTMLPRRATGVPPTPPEPTPPEPTPPTPTENPVKNPSFEQGLDYWEQVRYAPHPTRVDNSPEHLIEVSKEYVTHGRYSLHLRAWKNVTGRFENILRNVVVKVVQKDIDFSKFTTLKADVHAEMNFDAWRAPWGAYYGFVEFRVGNKKWWKHNKGVWDETIVLDISDISTGTIEIAAQVWDQDPAGAKAEIWVDNIRVE